MYGLKPDDIQHLTKLCGGEIIQVCVGMHDLRFHFHPSAHVSVWARCEMMDAAGNLIDAWDGQARSAPFRFHELLGRTVADVVIDTPRSFVITFREGVKLRIIDDSEQYESFSVNNLYV